VYVSEYSTTRHYGGPEEGGWYYDVRKFEKVIRSEDERDAAFACARRWNRKAKEGRIAGGRPQGRFSVLGGADVSYFVEDVAGSHDTTKDPVPHYE
jgi:hypothetical protein